jgi:uncharacterized protein YydD (DUF2326 family)
MDNEEIVRLGRELSEVHASTKQAHKRIDELQLVTKAFYDLASDVKVMVNEMSNMKKDITAIKSNIEEYHHKEPNKLMFNVKNTIITGVIGAIVGVLMALVLK